MYSACVSLFTIRSLCMVPGKTRDHQCHSLYLGFFSLGWLYDTWFQFALIQIFSCLVLKIISNHHSLLFIATFNIKLYLSYDNYVAVVTWLFVMIEYYPHSRVAGNTALFCWAAPKYMLSVCSLSCSLTANWPKNKWRLLKFMVGIILVLYLLRFSAWHRQGYH